MRRLLTIPLLACLVLGAFPSAFAQEAQPGKGEDDNGYAQISIFAKALELIRQDYVDDNRYAAAPAPRERSPPAGTPSRGRADRAGRHGSARTSRRRRPRARRPPAVPAPRRTAAPSHRSSSANRARRPAETHIKQAPHRTGQRCRVPRAVGRRLPRGRRPTARRPGQVTSRRTAVDTATAANAAA